MSPCNQETLKILTLLSEILNSTMSLENLYFQPYHKEFLILILSSGSPTLPLERTCISLVIRKHQEIQPCHQESSILTLLPRTFNFNHVVRNLQT